MTADEVQKLRSIRNEKERLDYIKEQIEENYFETSDFFVESDKSWDAMHRCLADGGLTWDGGKYPLNHVILAGELLYTQEDYIASLKTPEQVRDIAKALPAIDQQEIRRRYFRIDEKKYGFPVSEEDFNYTWDWFQNVREFYIRIAQSDRFVLFTANQ